MRYGDRDSLPTRSVLTIGALAIVLAAAGIAGLSAFWIYVATLYMCWLAVGAGMNVINGTCGMPALHGAAVIALAAYVYAILIERYSVVWPLALVLAVIGATLISTAVMAPVVRLRDFYLSIASFMAVLLVQQVLGQWESLTGGPFGLTVAQPSISGLSDVQSSFVVSIVCAAFAMIGFTLISYSRLGSTMRAARDSPPGAEASGVQVPRTLFTGLLLGNLLTACGGVALGVAMSFITPAQFGLALALQTLAVVFAGGLDRLTAPILGAFLVGVLPNLATGLQRYSTVLTLGVLLLILVLWPNGALAFSKASREKAVIR